jgi:hypothetical protein
MLRGVLHWGRRKVKMHFTKGRVRVWSLYLKPEMAEAIRNLKRWKKHGFATRLAEHTGFTRQMMAAVLRQKESCSVDVAMAIAEVAGLRPDEGECWCYLFEARLRETDSNSQTLNMDKFNGRRPYEKYSIAAEFRKLDDKNIEKRT